MSIGAEPHARRERADVACACWQLALVRRARVWDEHALRWNYVRPGQDWEDGEVTSPTELEQCRSEKELLRALQACVTCCKLIGIEHCLLCTHL